ncbi:hypothetical protein RM780_18485 [Streptomyces sp. DSM 44917]|uniref:Antitoxin FitA-like ribbon-helix-helix domain-containing protein n=1 Tax=Streptomyces boetiae TaxID=3075541 RepID=A0ABU2LBJ1_9ACTN|nr:hypothetical protein [Streptomyces sp. DSM 44917]MDT0308934.1 hypothetical protein [Streptomyces sp. DSM 44917]
MATVQIRNLDDRAYAVLRRRAADSGRSLQEYLRLRLEEEALRPTVDEVLGEVRPKLSGAGAITMTDILAAEREERGA